MQLLVSSLSSAPNKVVSIIGETPGELLPLYTALVSGIELGKGADSRAEQTDFIFYLSGSVSFTDRSLSQPWPVCGQSAPTD